MFISYPNGLIWAHVTSSAAHNASSSETEKVFLLVETNDEMNNNRGKIDVNCNSMKRHPTSKIQKAKKKSAGAIASTSTSSTIWPLSTLLVIFIHITITNTNYYIHWKHRYIETYIYQLPTCNPSPIPSPTRTSNQTDRTERKIARMRETLACYIYSRCRGIHFYFLFFPSNRFFFVLWCCSVYAFQTTTNP